MKHDCAYDELIEVHKLIPNPDNNNKHSKEQIERLAKIIDYQGQRSPIVVSNRSGFITKGHARLEALKSLGWERAAVDFQDYESEAMEYADITADNEIARWAELDRDSLSVKLKELPDLDVDILGILDLELSDVDVLDPQTDEDETPDVTHDPITKRGDVWLLGNHRVMCGDSTMIDDVEKLMAGEMVDMVFTDPPYNQSASGGGLTDKRPGFKKLINSNLNDFKPEATFEILDIIKSPTNYIFTSKDLIKDYIERYQDKNWTLLSMVKNH